MTYQRVPHCVEVHLNASQDGVPVVNRWYVDVGHTVTHEDLTGVFAVFDAWVTGSLSDRQVDSLHYETIVVKNVDVENGEELVYVPTTTQGTQTANPAPNSMAVVASLRTASTGRNYRGRTYIGGLNVGTMSDSTHIDSSTATAYAGVMTDLIDALETATYVLVVASKVLNGVQRAVAVVTEVVSVIVNTTIDNQRRRTAN